ncbi:dynein axonemal intermediate chain 3 isoform X2 [Hemibagrus wyckioides]|uniref:dynein axonemal intermediate chain 3 isoform X2 n=1 Tax=Hemibagrus wyckioides TaxID=337641 RepID=UPI00266BCD09|nr:dynein axonemal intermediate chain 3 isoform X2 [Hemibagrus wyckioides]
MSAKKPKSRVSKGKETALEKKNDLSPSPKEKKESSAPETNTGHPDYICPLVLTSATQELFSCRADNDVTCENPYKLLRKDDIIQDMRNRAAVSDFSPVKKAVLDYPEDEMLLVFDWDFTYGQRFYLVLTLEAKQSLLTPPAVTEEEEDEGGEEMEKEQRSPVPRRWVSLGSEKEIEEESVKDTRARFHFKVRRLGRKTGAPVHFSDFSSYTEWKSYPDESFSIRKLEQNRGVQAIANTKTSSSQTTWKHRKNMWTQYEPQELIEEEKEKILQSKNLQNFLRSSIGRIEQALQQNLLMDVFVNELAALGDKAVCKENDDIQLKLYQTFTELRYSKDKVISYINWHPTINGVIAVSVTWKLSFEERIDNSTELLLNPTMIIFWSISDPVHPLLLLECPDDVLSFQFCPSDTNIIVGGCMNGQVVLWDISGHADRLQRNRGGVRSKMTNTMDFKDKQHSDTPVVRYCAMSGFEGGHRGPVTDVQWLPDSFEVSSLGIPLENKNQISVQIVTCSPDGFVMFWDLRNLHVAAPSLTDKKHKAEEKPLHIPYRIPNTFKHLNLSWKPLFRVTLPKIDSAGKCSPLKISLRDSVCYSTAVDRLEVPSFSALHVPSAKHLHHLDNISTKFYVGTQDGELVYTDWKLEKDNETGQLSSPKPIHFFRVHHYLVNTVLRSPFFKDVILVVGGWTFSIWREGVVNGPLLHSPNSSSLCTTGFWSLTRPAVFFIGKEDGNLEVWNLLEKTHEPVLNQKITMDTISCIKPWIISSKQHYLAVSDHLGTLHVLEIPLRLQNPAPNEERDMSIYLQREVEFLIYYEKILEVREREERVKEEDKNRMRNVLMDDDEMEQLLQKEVQKDFEEYFILEKALRKKMGLEDKD